MSGGEDIGARAREARRRADLVALVEARSTKFQRSGAGHKCCCPLHAESTPSFYLKAREGVWKFHCFGCGKHGDALDFLMEADGLTLEQAIAAVMGGDARDPHAERRAAAREKEATRRAREEADKARKRAARARDWWDASVPARATAVETYLREARGIPLNQIPGGLPATLRCAPALDFWHEGRAVWRGPAMLARVINRDGDWVGMHVTWLAPDGSGKARLPVDPQTKKPMRAKKMFGAVWGGWTPLYAGHPGRQLHVGEGIETMLSVAAAKGEPTGALLSLNNIAGAGRGARPDLGEAHWRPPEGVGAIWLWTDNDSKTEDNRLAHDALYRRALTRWTRLGYAVERIDPPRGRDWNDVLRDGGRR